MDVGYTPAKKNPVMNRKIRKIIKLGDKAAKKLPTAAINAFILKNNGVFIKSGKLKTE
jgi:hypothetical protein